MAFFPYPFTLTLPLSSFQVAVVKVRNTDKVFAMKILNKWEMLKRAEVRVGAGGLRTRGIVGNSSCQAEARLPLGLR